MRRRGQGRPPVDFKARDSDPIFRLRSDPNFHKCQIRSTDSGQIRGRGLGLFSPVHGKFINFEFKVYGCFQVLGKYNYRNEGGVRLAKYIKTLGIKGVDLVFDTVGGTELARESLKAIRFGGRFCIIGWTSTPMAGGGRGAGADHATANMIPTNLVMMKGAKVIGCPVAINTKLDPSIREPRLKVIDKWVEDGLMKPFVSHTFPFENFREALIAKWERKITGSCILRCE